MKIGVFTVSVPEWDPMECLEKLAKIGYDGSNGAYVKTRATRPSLVLVRQPYSMTAEEVFARAKELKAKAKATGMAMPSSALYRKR